jgi:hypothetical protein
MTKEVAMSVFSILQARIGRDALDAVNSMGWDKAMVLYPELAIKRECAFGGSEGFSAWMSKYYWTVANVYRAKDMEDVFDAGNGYAPKGVELVKVDAMHSCSVGDIIHNHEDGTYHMVDGEGFTQLLSFNVEAA